MVGCCKLLGRTSDEVGEAGGRDLDQIVARTGYASPYTIFAVSAAMTATRLGDRASFTRRLRAKAERRT
jgi:hypothetical protein